MGLLPRAELELPASLSRTGIDACLLQALQALRAFLFVYDLDDPIARGQTFRNEGNDHGVFVFAFLEEGANVAATINNGASQADGPIT
jgi:hypothetical protein